MPRDRGRRRREPGVRAADNRGALHGRDGRRASPGGRGGQRDDEQARERLQGAPHGTGLHCTTWLLVPPGLATDYQRRVGPDTAKRGSVGHAQAGRVLHRHRGRISSCRPPGFSDPVGRIRPHDLHDEGGVRRAPARRAGPPPRRRSRVAEGHRRGRGPAARLPRADRGAAEASRARREHPRRPRRLSPGARPGRGPHGRGHPRARGRRRAHVVLRRRPRRERPRPVLARRRRPGRLRDAAAVDARAGRRHGEAPPDLAVRARRLRRRHASSQRRARSPPPPPSHEPGDHGRPRDQEPARPRRRQGDPARARPHRQQGRGPRPHGPQRLGQVDAGQRDHGPADARGHRGLRSSSRARTSPRPTPTSAPAWASSWPSSTRSRSPA